MIDDAQSVPSSEDDSPVGDVRRVRESLSRQFDNDVRKLAEHAKQVTDALAGERGLRRVAHASDATRPARP